MQEECAWYGDIAISYYRSIEKGQVNPTLDVLLRLSAALGVEFDIILGNTTPLRFTGISKSDSQALREIAAELDRIVNRL